MAGEPSLGVKKLTEYLQKTREQAENAIDVLNTKIGELSDENQNMRNRLRAAEAENVELRNLTENLKNENPRKWRFKERDDWKSLVDSIQKDRSRLQEECAKWQLLLVESQAKNSALEEEIRHLKSTIASSITSHEVLVSSAQKNELSKIEENEIVLEPRSPKTPRSLNKVLEKTQIELEKTHNQMHIERRSRDIEIYRLREELDRYRELTAGGSKLGASSSAVVKYSSGSNSSTQPPVSFFGMLGQLFFPLYSSSSRHASAPTARRESSRKSAGVLKSSREIMFV